jgi:hypothetical protein
LRQIFSFRRRIDSGLHGGVYIIAQRPVCSAVVYAKLPAAVILII